MKKILVTMLVSGILGSGCLLVRTSPPPRGSSASSLEEEKCPPGHRWSDGRCHETGKGHDPDKKRGKGKP